MCRYDDLMRIKRIVFVAFKIEFDADAKEKHINETEIARKIHKPIFFYIYYHRVYDIQ